MFQFQHPPSQHQMLGPSSAQSAQWQQLKQMNKLILNSLLKQKKQCSLDKFGSGVTIAETFIIPLKIVLSRDLYPWFKYEVELSTAEISIRTPRNPNKDHNLFMSLSNGYAYQIYYKDKNAQVNLVLA